MEPVPGPSREDGVQQQELIHEEGVPEALSNHFRKLQFFCRVCGVVRIESRSYLVTENQNDLLNFMSLDISNDNSNTHPQLMCRACLLKLQRFKEKFTRRRVKTPFEPFEWSEHSEEKCFVCDFNLRRSPRKPTPRKSTPMKRPASEEPEERVTPRKKLVFGVTEEKQGVHAITLDATQVVTTERIITSVPGELLQNSMGIHLSCSLCKNVPLQACTLKCTHLYCKDCLNLWMTHNAVCSVCKEPADSKEIVTITEELKPVYDCTTAKCVNCYNGCDAVIELSRYVEHVKSCTFTVATPDVRKKGGWSWQNKASLSQVRNKRYVKNVRLAEIIGQIDKFCETKHESKLDILYFLLIAELKALGHTDKADSVAELQEGIQSSPLTPDESLAMRVDMLQSKTQYKKQYELLKAKGDKVLATPYQLDKVEGNYMPPSVNYQVTGEDNQDIFTYEAGIYLFSYFV